MGKKEKPFKAPEYINFPTTPDDKKALERISKATNLTNGVQISKRAIKFYASQFYYAEDDKH